MTVQMVAIMLAGMVNLVILLTVVLKAGQLLADLAMLTDIVKKLEGQVDTHGRMLASAVVQLDALEKRVERLERQEDGHR